MTATREQTGRGSGGRPPNDTVEPTGKELRS